MHSLSYLTLDKEARQLRRSDVAALAAQISVNAQAHGLATPPATVLHVIPRPLAGRDFNRSVP